MTSLHFKCSLRNLKVFFIFKKILLLLLLCREKVRKKEKERDPFPVFSFLPKCLQYCSGQDQPDQIQVTGFSPDLPCG